MPRTKSKKTKAGGRRLPLRSEVKKLKPNETISIEDDPEQRSSSPPVMAAPLSQVLSSSSLKTIFGRVEQSVGVAMKVYFIFCLAFYYEIVKIYFTGTGFG
jgi:hypothetical protein